MRARSALFDLYGDHIVRRGGWAPVGGLVRTLEALDIAGPATRTAVSRMVREGWLEPVVRRNVRGYTVTPRAARQLADAHRRIYTDGEPAWSGSWDVVTFEPPTGRAAKERVGAVLRYLGYAPMTATTWVSARRHPDLSARFAGEQVSWRGFTSTFDGDDRALAADLWDLPAIARGYREFMAQLCEDADLAGDARLDTRAVAQAYADRARLVHRWRLFLFSDPGLPAAVLPADWPRASAAAAFRTHADALAQAADAFVDECLRS